MTANSRVIYEADLPLPLSGKQSDVWHLLEDDRTVTEVFYGGAAGGGKTTIICAWQIARRIAYPGTRGIIARFTFEDLMLTTVKRFWEVWNAYYAENPFGVTATQVSNEIRFSNGSEIILRWINTRSRNNDRNYGMGSFEFTDAAVDEAPEVPEGAVNMLSSRIRYKLPNGTPKLLLAGNPANNWIKYRYVKSRDGKPVILKPHQAFVQAGLKDNPDREFARTYRRQLENLPPADRARLLAGDWDYVENEKPFFQDYNPAVHISREPLPVDPYESLVLSFDFNINPATVVRGQMIWGKGIYIQRVMQKDGGTGMLCEDLTAHEWHLHQGGIRVTGDSSGFGRHSAAGLDEFGDYNTDYNVIKKALLISDSSIVHTAHQNPRHEYSRRLCNYAFHRRVIQINPEGCTALTEDLAAAQATPDGKLYKNREAGMGMDAADAFRYFVHMCFPNGIKDVDAFAEMMGLERAQSILDLPRPDFHSLKTLLNGRR